MGWGFPTRIWDAVTFELKHTFEQEYKVNITVPTSLFRPTQTRRIESRATESTPAFCLTPILNLILHIVYKWEFVSFLESNENTSRIEEVTRTLGECVHDGYNITSEIK